MIHRRARLHYGTNVAVLRHQRTVPNDRHLSKCPAHEFIDVACRQVLLQIIVAVYDISIQFVGIIEFK